MDLTLVISIMLGIAAFVVINIVFDIRFFEGSLKTFLDVLDSLAERLGKYNTKRYIERIKKERIVKRKENIFAKYNRLVEGLILDFNMPFTLESFTSILCILFCNKCPCYCYFYAKHNSFYSYLSIYFHRYSYILCYAV